MLTYFHQLVFRINFCYLSVSRRTFQMPSIPLRKAVTFYQEPLALSSLFLFKPFTTFELFPVKKKNNKKTKQKQRQSLTSLFLFCNVSSITSKVEEATWAKEITSHRKTLRNWMACTAKAKVTVNRKCRTTPSRPPDHHIPCWICLGILSVLLRDNMTPESEHVFLYDGSSSRFDHFEW